MARPKQIDDEALLDSLSATFLELGPTASSQELARRAGVSEGTLFKRFGTKARLFVRAMRLPELQEQPWFTGMAARAGRGALDQHLIEVGRGLHEFIAEVLPRIHTIQANGKLKPSEVANLLTDSDHVPATMMQKAFSSYFAAEMEHGRLRKADPEALAGFFMGAIVHNCHLRSYFPEQDGRSPGEFVRWLVSSFIELAGPSRDERG